MLSIFIMFSNDRLAELQTTIHFLEQMPLYQECQKTLIVDGKLNTLVPGWNFVQVPRLNDQFCWGRMWDAGVSTARYEKIIYLDSDRLLPSNFLELCNQHIADNKFVFTSKHFILKNPISNTVASGFLNGTRDMFEDPELIGNLQFEIRHKTPLLGHGKNVMSGSTGFTRMTYVQSGGVDHWYQGHGAYADTDYHMQVSRAGCTFVDLDLPELHLPHDKKDNEQNIDDTDFKLAGLKNFIHYCLKWDIPLVYAENLAHQIGIIKPKRIITELIRLS